MILRSTCDPVISPAGGEAPSDILGYFGEIVMSNISEKQLLAWASGYAAKMSPTGFNNAIAHLNWAFADVVKSGLRFTNPADALKRLRPNQKNLSARLDNRKGHALLRRTGRRMAWYLEL